MRIALRFLDQLATLYFPASPLKRRALWTYNTLVILALADRLL